MKALTQIDAFELLCKSTKNWGIFLSFRGGYNGTPDIFEAVPYLKDHSSNIQMLCDGMAILLFETEEEMEHHYYRTVGDDGPTKFNSYDGECRVYALTCSPSGQLMNENT